MARADPFVRSPMRPAGAGGAHSGALRAPDVAGVYALRLVHGRVGLSGLGAGEEVAVRPLRHDEHPRFLLAAYPYYASALSCVAATFVLGAMFLYGAEPKGGKAKAE
uniref:OST48 middle domain-containing protein n=1 Tax=Hemiselmis andersenii TaxID=464988 RepID=A0A7S1DQ52_HEMAN